MSLTKEQVCVIISSGDHLEQSVKLLNQYNQKFWRYESAMDLSCQTNILICDTADSEWFLTFWNSSARIRRTEIALSELETILKAEHEALQKD